MSIYHCSIKIISRSSGRSAVASAAYRSGEKLYNDETGLIHDFTNKGGVILNEIILPDNAPTKYKDRETLWNEVQQIEKRADAQLAREVEVALPVEMSRDEQITCVRDYIQENFISEGMIADWALHDKGDGNPHAHIMLTVRGFDDNSAWVGKQKTIFANALDDNNRPIYNPELPVYDPTNRDATSQYRIPILDENGEQKVRVREGKGMEKLWAKISIPCNNWNDRANAEKWRKSWATNCNRYLDDEHKIDHRSYEKQGRDIVPTIHEGVTARNMEKDGKISERCQVNRDIRERNSILKKIKEVSKELAATIAYKTKLISERLNDLNPKKENPKTNTSNRVSIIDKLKEYQQVVKDNSNNVKTKGQEKSVR